MEKKTIIISNQMTQKYSDFITKALEEFSNDDIQGIIMLGITKDKNSQQSYMKLHAWQANTEDFEKAEMALREVVVASRANAMAMNILEDAYAEDLASEEVGYDEMGDEFKFEEQYDCDE